MEFATSKKFGKKPEPAPTEEGRGEEDSKLADSIEILIEEATGTPKPSSKPNNKGREIIEIYEKTIREKTE